MFAWLNHRLLRQRVPYQVNHKSWVIFLISRLTFSYWTDGILQKKFSNFGWSSESDLRDILMQSQRLTSLFTMSRDHIEYPWRSTCFDKSSAIFIHEWGECSSGLSTIEFPAANAGAISNAHEKWIIPWRNQSIPYGSLTERFSAFLCIGNFSLHLIDTSAMNRMFVWSWNIDIQAIADRLTHIHGIHEGEFSCIC